MPAAWVKEAIGPSQEMNPEYGYLWWNNTTGKKFPGVPTDAYAALGTVREQHADRAELGPDRDSPNRRRPAAEPQVRHERDLRRGLRGGARSSEVELTAEAQRHGVRPMRMSESRNCFAVCIQLSRFLSVHSVTSAVNYLHALFALATLDYAVVVVYLVAMLCLGASFRARRKRATNTFSPSRSIPWFAIGLSIIATLMSSLTYVSEPGEVWKSGITNMLGKMLAIPFEMALVWLVFIPFLTKLRYTSAYDYLGDRFGAATKWLGIALFLWLAVAWMGFIVLVSSRILADASGIDLTLVIAVVGVVATVYTVAGGLRAVIWTDVVQVVLMLGGALMTIVYVALETSSTSGRLVRTRRHEALDEATRVGSASIRSRGRRSSPSR